MRQELLTSIEDYLLAQAAIGDTNGRDNPLAIDTARGIMELIETAGDDPFTIFDDAAIGLHELLESYVRAGFTRKEGMELVKIHLVEYLTEPEESE